MVHVHCPLERGRREEDEKKLCGLAGESEDEREDQRSKRARLLTRFQKGDTEGRRDHFHFDQKFSSKTQKHENENLFLVEKRDQRLANLFGNNNNAHNQSCEVKSTLFCKVPYFYTILYLTSTSRSKVTISLDHYFTTRSTLLLSYCVIAKYIIKVPPTLHHVIK